jgi:long-chain acyl-CoA synthetase
MTAMNLASILSRTAERGGDRPAVRLGEATMTYRELDEASARVAGLLGDRGIQGGDRIGVMLPNTPEVASYLGDSDARLLFAWHGFADEASAGAKRAEVEAVVVDPASFAEVLASAEPDRAVADRQEDDTAVILYTSGTTGQPKGAELTHANLVRNTEVGRTDLFRLTAEAVASGAALSLLPRFDPARALQILAGHRATVFMAVPTMYTALLHSPDRAAYDVSALRLAVSGGAAMPVEVLRGFEEAFGCSVLEGYGLSETSPLASFNHPDRQRKPGTIGTPIRGVEMRVVDEQGAELPQGQVGEIAIRGHNVMKGYWRRPEETAKAVPDGWFRTGDIGRVDEDGYFAIVDRKKDLIIRGGYNVYPREVEEVLYEHPAVGEAAVIGLPHPELGEEVGAAVVLKPGAQAAPEELRDFVKGQVAAYKYPRRVWIVEALPKTATAKILKREIVPPPGLVERP